MQRLSVDINKKSALHSVGRWADRNVPNLLFQVRPQGALDLLDATSPLLLITPVRVPGVDGAERGAKPHVPASIAHASFILSFKELGRCAKVCSGIATIF